MTPGTPRFIARRLENKEDNILEEELEYLLDMQMTMLVTCTDS